MGHSTIQNVPFQDRNSAFFFFKGLCCKLHLFTTRQRSDLHGRLNEWMRWLWLVRTELVPGESSASFNFF
jgi:hypothetical protein